MSDDTRKDVNKLEKQLKKWESLLKEHKCDEQEGKETIKALKVAIASVETNEAPGKDNNVTPKDETVGNINILRMIEELKKIGGGSLECKLNYCKDGVLYSIKISIEEVEHE